MIGREREIEIVRDYIRRRKSLHIHGPSGVGKSALLNHIYRTWREISDSPVPIYCRNSGTFRTILVLIAEFLLGRGEKLISIDKFGRENQVFRSNELRTIPTRYLRNMVFPHVKKGDFYVILDHLEDVTPRIHSLLSALHGCSSVVTASRQGWDLSDYRSFPSNLTLWHVPKLPMGNLEKKDAFMLIESLSGTSNIKVADELHMFKDIYEISLGNPKMIENIFEKAADPKYLHEGKLNLNLIIIDCQIEEVRMP
ncbi:MAG TPA: ATP-binding protein [Nitrospirota bacterium]|nr:ATP-binding protein [Nitrospirota bacterium]